MELVLYAERAAEAKNGVRVMMNITISGKLISLYAACTGALKIHIGAVVKQDGGQTFRSFYQRNSWTSTKLIRVVNYIKVVDCIVLDIGETFCTLANLIIGSVKVYQIYGSLVNNTTCGAIIARFELGKISRFEMRTACFVRAFSVVFSNIKTQVLKDGL